MRRTSQGFRFSRLLIIFALLLSVAASQVTSQKTKSKRAATSKKESLSRDFRKSAFLAKTAWDQLLASVGRNDSKEQLQRYQDEADKAETMLKADQQTEGDSGAHICILDYESKVIQAQIQLSLSHGDYSKSKSGFDMAEFSGRVVDAILSDGAYSKQCGP